MLDLDNSEVNSLRKHGVHSSSTSSSRLCPAAAAKLRTSPSQPVARGRATLRRHRLFHTMRRRRGPRSAPELLPPARISHSLAPARRHPARSAPRPPPAGGCRRPHGAEPRPSPLGYRPRSPAAPPPPLGFARCLRLCLPEPHIAEQSS